MAKKKKKKENKEEEEKKIKGLYRSPRGANVVAGLSTQQFVRVEDCSSLQRCRSI